MGGPVPPQPPQFRPPCWEKYKKNISVFVYQKNEDSNFARYHATFYKHTKIHAINPIASVVTNLYNYRV